MRRLTECVGEFLLALAESALDRGTFADVSNEAEQRRLPVKYDRNRDDFGRHYLAGSGDEVHLEWPTGISGFRQLPDSLDDNLNRVGVDELHDRFPHERRRIGAKAAGGKPIKEEELLGRVYDDRFGRGLDHRSVVNAHGTDELFSSVRS